MFAPAFRGAVGGEGPHRREHLPRAAHDRYGAHHAARKEADPEARSVARAPLLSVHECLEMAVEALHLGRPLGLHEIDALVGVEGGGEHLPAARHHREERAVHVAEDVEEGQVVQHHVRFGDRESLHSVALVAEEAVAAHHPLGEAGGSGGEHDEEGVVHRYLPRPRGERRVAYRAPRREEGGEGGDALVLVLRDGDDPFEPREALAPQARMRVRAPAVAGAVGAAAPDAADRRVGTSAGLAGGPVAGGEALRDQLAHHGEVVDRAGDVVGDEGRAVALAHRVLEVAGAEAGVGGDEDRADAGDREQEVDPFGGVVEPEAHLVARRDAERDESFRRLVDPPRDLREGLPHRPEDERLPLAPPRGGPRRQLPDRGAAVPAPAVARRQPAGRAGHPVVQASHPTSASAPLGRSRRPARAAGRPRSPPGSILPPPPPLPSSEP